MLPEQGYGTTTTCGLAMAAKDLARLTMTRLACLILISSTGYKNRKRWIMKPKRKWPFTGQTSADCRQERLRHQKMPSGKLFVFRRPAARFSVFGEDGDVKNVSALARPEPTSIGGSILRDNFR